MKITVCINGWSDKEIIIPDEACDILSLTCYSFKTDCSNPITSVSGPRRVFSRYDVYCMDDPLHWRHNWRNGVSNHQPHHCLLNRWFRRRSKKTSKLRVTGLWAGKSSVTGEFPAQMASNAENVSIWWRHHAFMRTKYTRPQMSLATADPPSSARVTISCFRH